MDFKDRFSSIADGSHAYKNSTRCIKKNTILVNDPRHKKDANAVNPNTRFIPPASEELVHSRRLSNRSTAREDKRCGMGLRAHLVLIEKAVCYCEMKRGVRKETAYFV